jgi:hypothetical protein
LWWLSVGTKVAGNYVKLIVVWDENRSGDFIENVKVKSFITQPRMVVLLLLGFTDT